MGQFTQVFRHDIEATGYNIFERLEKNKKYPEDA